MRPVEQFVRTCARPLIVSAALALTVVSGPVAAESVAGTIAEMASINKEMKALKDEADGLLAENVNSQKEADLWREQLDSRLTPLYASYTVKANESIAEEERLTTEINRYISTCTGELSQPQYDKCASEEPVLKEAREKHIAERLVLIKEKEDLDKEWSSYTKLIDESSNLIKKNYERHLAIMNTFGRRKEQLEYYRLRLIGLCDSPEEADNTDEAIRLCHSVNWDGANRTLPSLDEILRGTQFFE